MHRLSVIVLMAIVAIKTSSCGNVKNLQYVQGAFDTAKLSKIQFTEPVIQRGDLLGITLYSDDGMATAAVMSQPVDINISAKDQQSSSSGQTVPQAAAAGFLVDGNGFIQLYKLGQVHAEGLTKKQLADTLARRYTDMALLKNPYAEIRFLNYKVTLIGEVSKPGTYSFPTEKISIFDALGMAGDITMYGKRNNVMIVREINGTRQFAQLDLSKPDVFASPYYYLQQNDMVIVDVAKNKAAVSDQTTFRTVTLTTSIMATIAILINIFK